MAKRESISKIIETEVLSRCARRCCVCYGLNGDHTEKSGQIAHLDRDSSNNSVRNLVYLCLVHHDQYDTRTSQSKGLTLGEVKLYRSQLHEAVARMRDNSFTENQTTSPAETQANDPTLLELLYQHLDETNRQILDAIIESDDLAGANLAMLVEQLDLSGEVISSSLEKMEQLEIIYETGRSELGVFYDIDHLKVETVFVDHYRFDDEPPITRFLRIDFVTGYNPEETSRFILQGYGSQNIVIKLKDMEQLVKHLDYLVSRQKKSEIKRLRQ